MPKKPTGDIDKVIGQRLNALRQTRGLGLKDLAASIDVSMQQYSRYEAGTNALRVSQAVMLSRRLQVRIVDLLDGLAETLT